MQALIEKIAALPRTAYFGRVTGVRGMTIEVAGVERQLSIGARCRIETRGGGTVDAEVVGIKGHVAVLLPFGRTDGLGMGCRAFVGAPDNRITPSPAWLGRVLNAHAEPIDGGTVLPQGSEAYFLRQAPPPAHQRSRVAGKLDVGVRAINSFLSICRGQRMGIFAGSGVGKSVLLSMLARFTACDIAVIGLIGERGREVREFIQDHLGEAGLSRAIVVVATSDEPPLLRRQAALLTLTLAEYFRDRGQQVLCLIDSLTRLAMAEREIGLASGEPPTAKGYTPSVFSEMSKLLERAGPGTGEAAITGLFTVLVEGDDTNEPISDAVRGILDGHIILDRRIAERGRFPAIDILKSISRTMPQCNSPEETAMVNEARRLLALYDDMAELVRLGAYRAGTDPEIDRAIRLNPALEGFLSQDIRAQSSLAEGYQQLASILSDVGNDAAASA